jgi:hypothetical protein
MSIRCADDAAADAFPLAVDAGAGLEADEAAVEPAAVVAEPFDGDDDPQPTRLRAGTLTTRNPTAKRRMFVEAGRAITRSPSLDHEPDGSISRGYHSIP